MLLLLLLLHCTAFHLVLFPSVLNTVIVPQHGCLPVSPLCSLMPLLLLLLLRPLVAQTFPSPLLLLHRYRYVFITTQIYPLLLLLLLLLRVRSSPVLFINFGSWGKRATVASCGVFGDLLPAAQCVSAACLNHLGPLFGRL